jgi:hypothetical protein
MTTGEQLRRDFAPFIDPATDLRVTEGTLGIRLQLVRDGSEHDYFFDLRDQSVIARGARARKFASLRSFFASPDFADTRTLATTQLRMLKTFDPDQLIAPEGEVNSVKLTKQSLQQCVSPARFVEGSAQTKIGLVLIDGPAGVGKTSLINSLLVQRAKRQQEAAPLPPILHVASRGKRISVLNQVLAESIDLIRAKFTFDQVPTLIRYNLLQVAIDGFDELVDSEGYRDAWSALKQFFEDTIYGGPIILAGRDTFFDQQGFRRQLRSSQYSFDLTHVRLTPVSPKAAREWLAKGGWSETDLRDSYTKILLRAGSYTLRPFFLTQLAAAQGWRGIDSQDLTPRAFLVERFLAREATLLSSQLVSIPKDTIREGLSYLFDEIALEMAGNETEAIDLSFLQLVTEAAFSQFMAPQDLAKLVHKSGSFALLESDVREGYRRFPHTEILYHFLVLGLIRTVAGGTRTSVLRRGALTSDILSIFVELFARQPVSVTTKFVEFLDRMLLDDITYDRLPENVGALAISSLSHDFLSTTRVYADLSVTDAVLSGVVSAARLDRIKIQRLDAREAKLAHVQFVDCEIVHLTVDETTQFGASHPSVHNLLLSGESGHIADSGDCGQVFRLIADSDSD